MKFLFTLLILIPATLCAQNKVGINTTSPSSDLDIRGDDDTWDGGELQLATPSMTNFIRMFGGRLGDRNPFLAFSDQDTFHFVTTTWDWSNFTRRISISPGGNLGIGITSPLHRLSIKGSSSSSAAVLKAESTYLGNVHVNGIEAVALPAAGYGKGGHFTGGGRGVQAWAEGGSSTALVIGVEGSALGTAGTRVGIYGRALGGTTNWAGYFDEGNVYVKHRLGAGTLNPDARMHLFENSSTSLPQLRLTETSANDFSRIKMENFNEPGIFWDIAGKADSSATESKLNFFYANAGNTGDKLTITGEGNIGVGTTSPADKLHVNGDIRVSGLAGSGDRNVIVNSNGKLIASTLGSGGGGWIENGSQTSTTLDALIDAPDGPTSSLTIDGKETNGNNFAALAIYNSTFFPGGTYHRMLLDADEIDVFRGTGVDPLDADLSIQNTSGGNLMLVNGGGNVGIGTPTPGSKLTIHGPENNGINGVLEIKTINSTSKMVLDGNEIDSDGGGRFI